MCFKEAYRRMAKYNELRWGWRFNGFCWQLVGFQSYLLGLHDVTKFQLPAAVSFLHIAEMVDNFRVKSNLWADCQVSSCCLLVIDFRITVVQYRADKTTSHDLTEVFLSVNRRHEIIMWLCGCLEPNLWALLPTIDFYTWKAASSRERER